MGFLNFTLEPPEQKFEQETLNIQKKQAQLDLRDREDDQTYMQQMDMRSNLIRWQQEHDEEVLNLITQLRTERAQDNKPLCNDHFINKAVTILKGLLSKNTINSNYREDEVMDVLRNTFDELADDMADNYHDYDIRFEDLDVILRIVKNECRSAINRSKMGWTLKTNSQMAKVQEISTRNDDRDPKGFLGIFK